MKEKLSLYEYLNFVLIGLIFTGCCVLVLKDDEWVKTIFKEIKSLSLGIEVVITSILFGLIYEIGFIINRIGSIVIEPIFKKFKIIKIKMIINYLMKEKNNIRLWKYYRGNLHWLELKFLCFLFFW